MNYKTFCERFGLAFKPHQELAVSWCLERERKPRKLGHGGLIADEMGLGKTYQMMAVILGNLLQNTLIVCPVALLDQWAAVLNQCRTEDSPEVIIYRGSQRRHVSLEALSSSICLTTYGEISRKNHDRMFASPIHGVQWSRVVFDEAHHMRNGKTSVSKAGLALRSQIKWLLTGTPIQNSFKDFHSLCQIIGVPYHMYSGDKMDLTGLTKTYILKRTKKGVGIPMPELKEETISVSWANKHEAEVAAMIHNRIGMSRHEDKLPSFGPMIVDYIRARQMCVLPSLLQTQVGVLKRYEESMNAEDRDGLGLMEQGVQGTSKLEAVANKIIERQGEEFGRKIVFCEYRREIDYLETRLLQAGIVTMKIDGTIRGDMRKVIIESEVPDVLLLQIRTCSEGLNLQQYNEIYIVSPQWNPCVEAQAVCRSYRMGQNRPVSVFRFTMDNHGIYSTKNMENHVLEIQEEKKKLMVQLEECK
jgi:SNF2 family DNA or RNA helicase